MGPKALFTHSKAEWMTRQGIWFEYVSDKDILARVSKWMHDKTDEAKAGDAVNIFFQC
jgi:hypothetical protein